jgi:hypothetical protein
MTPENYKPSSEMSAARTAALLESFKRRAGNALTGDVFGMYEEHTRKAWPGPLDVPTSEKPNSGFPPKGSWTVESVLDGQGDLVTSGRIPERGWGRLGHVDTNFESHFCYQPLGEREPFIEDISDIIMGGKVVEALQDASAVVKFSGRHILLPALSATDRGLVLIPLPRTDPVRRAWACLPWKDEQGVWRDRPKHFVGSPKTRLHSISVQALWLPPKTWFSYHDITDVHRLHPILVEPVHYYDDPDDSGGEPI